MDGVSLVAKRGYDTQEAAEQYSRCRPTWSREMIDIVIGKLNLNRNPGNGNTKYDIVELGAGTGMATIKMLEALGENVHFLATEPIGAFLAKLKATLPHVDTLQCSAGDIKLPDNSVKAVVAFHCVHWFANEEAFREIHRVLVPGGAFVFLWNERDISVPWVKTFDDMIYEPCPPELRNVHRWKEPLAALGPNLFTEAKEEIHKETQELRGDRQTILDYVSSMSYISCLPPPERERLLGKFLQFLNTHPDVKGKQMISIPFNTEIYWCYKVS